MCSNDSHSSVPATTPSQGSAFFSSSDKIAPNHFSPGAGRTSESLRRAQFGTPKNQVAEERTMTVPMRKRESRIRKMNRGFRYRFEAAIIWEEEGEGREDRCEW